MAAIRVRARFQHERSMINDMGERSRICHSSGNQFHRRHTALEPHAMHYRLDGALLFFEAERGQGRISVGPSTRPFRALSSSG